MPLPPPVKAEESLGLEVVAASIPLHNLYPSGPSLHHDGADITIQCKALQLYCRERTLRFQTDGLKTQVIYTMQTDNTPKYTLTFPGKKIIRV